MYNEVNSFRVEKYIISNLKQLLSHRTIKDISGFFQQIHIMHSIPFGNKIPKAFNHHPANQQAVTLKGLGEVGRKI